MGTKNLAKLKSALEHYERMLALARRSDIEIGTHERRSGTLDPVETRGGVWSHLEIRPGGTLGGKVMYTATRKQVELSLGIELNPFGASTVLNVNHAIILAYSAHIEQNPIWNIRSASERGLGGILMQECVIPTLGTLKQDGAHELYVIPPEHALTVAGNLFTWFSRLPK